MKLQIACFWPILGCVATIFSLSAVASAQELSITKTVLGTTGPWNWVAGGLNSAFQYGINNQTAPIVFSHADGFAFTPGSDITIQYIDGLVSADSGVTQVNADGDTNSVSNDGLGITGKVAPSAYFSSADYPANLMVLTGVFASNAGAIIGTPFKIALGRTVVIPTGAARLQLGTNDDEFGDNTGSFQVKVTAAIAPEPLSIAFLAVLIPGSTLR